MVRMTIDHHTIDVLLGAGWDTSATDEPKNQKDFETTADHFKKAVDQLKYISKMATEYDVREDWIGDWPEPPRTS